MNEANTIKQITEIESLTCTMLVNLLFWANFLFLEINSYFIYSIIGLFYMYSALKNELAV